MVNPTLAAVDLINSFDRMQTPEHTEGTEVTSGRSLLFPIKARP